MLTNSENFEVTKFQEKDMNTDKGTPVKEMANTTVQTDLNTTCERDRRRKLKEKSLKLSTKDKRHFPPEYTTCKLMPSGDNQIVINISSRKCKNENV